VPVGHTASLSLTNPEIGAISIVDHRAVSPPGLLETFPGKRQGSPSRNYDGTGGGEMVYMAAVSCSLRHVVPGVASA
jgi:hypothetical protein